jgi:Co/Zn/Cd efflux system component
MVTQKASLEELWGFSDREIRRQGARQERRVAKTMRGDPPETLLYAVLCGVYEGHDTRAKLYTHLGSMFAVRLARMTVSPVDVDEAIQHGVNEDLLSADNGSVSITEKGVSILRASRLQIVHEGYWMKRFLQEKNVVLTSAFVLVLLVVLKISTGLSLGSRAMVNDGLENLTDLVVVGIIALSLRYKKDRLGAIAIMVFMLISGSLLGINGVLRLLSPEEISASYSGYIVVILSIVLNLGLIYYKTLVGRMSGNLALVSDAKEDQSHIRIGAGVIVGLLFAEFHIYVIDSIVAVLIALVIIWEGIEALREIVQAGDSLSVDTIHLAAADQYDDLITAWILAQLARSSSTEGELNDAFVKGLTIGYRYYDVHAIIGFKDLEQKGLTKHIQTAKRSGLITEEAGTLSITNRGLSMYYKNRVQEMKRLSRNFSREISSVQSVAYFFIGFTAFILFVVYGSSVYQAVFDFLRAALGM